MLIRVNCNNLPLIPSGFELQPSQIPGYGMGIWTTQSIPIGAQLDFNSAIIDSHPGRRERHLWEVYKESGELHFIIDTRSTWIQHMQFARRDSEATVLADLKNKTLQLTVIRPLLPGTELLLKLSLNICQMWDVPLTVKKEDDVYECSDCPKAFCNPYSLTIHQLYYCGQESFLWCDECGQVFGLPESLRQHISQYCTSAKSSPRPFDTENLLKKSMAVYVPKLLPFQLNDDISKIFLTYLQLAQNQRLSATKQNLQEFLPQLWPFQCEHCGKPFSHQSSLKVHLRMHSEEKPFRCNTCKKTFSRRDSLQAHVRTHTKPFNCEKCGRSFARPDSLIAHARNHTGGADRPFKCTECGKGFGVAQALQTHMRIHTGEKPFKCKHCPKAFAHMSSLKVHVNSTHTGLKPFQCQHCTMRFADGSNLRRHIQTHTNEKPHVCKACGKAFARGSILKEHLRTHTRHDKRTGEKGKVVTSMIMHKMCSPKISLTVPHPRISPPALPATPNPITSPTLFSSQLQRSTDSAFSAPTSRYSSLPTERIIRHESQLQKLQQSLVTSTKVL